MNLKQFAQGVRDCEAPPVIGGRPAVIDRIRAIDADLLALNFPRTLVANSQKIGRLTFERIQLMRSLHGDELDD